MNRIALNFELPQAEAGTALPDWLLLVPAGRFVGRDRRSWVNDQPDQAVAYNRALNRDVVFDIEHASEIKAPQGEPAPAVGWFKQLEVRDGAIWGRVDWNEDGAALIQGRKYRYYSPAIIYDAEDRVIGIASVGLTNKHNLDIPALNHETHHPEDDMSLAAAIRQALGLAETANEADAVLAIGNLKSAHQTALNSAQQPPLDKFIPRADYDLVVSKNTELQTALNSERGSKLESEIAALVDGAIKEKKIAPASRDHYVALCRQSGTIEHVKGILEKSPALLTDTDLDSRKPGDADKVALNQEEARVSAMFGNSAEDIAKFGK